MSVHSRFGVHLRFYALIVTLFCLFVPSVEAGTWQVTYTGGTRTMPNTPPASYAMHNPPPGYGFIQNNISNATLSGAITATFTWQPAYTGEQPPASVLLSEYSRAEAVAQVPQGNPNPQVAADNGLNAKQVVTERDWTYYYQPVHSISVLSESSRYRIRENPGTQFTVTCSPTASCSATIGFGNVSVRYSAKVSNIGIRVLGTRRDENDNQEILVGQGAVGNVFTDDPSLSFQNYRWAYPSWTFKEYVVASNNSSAYVVELSAADMVLPNPTWYWRRDGNDNVSCTVDVYKNNIKIETVTLTCGVKVWIPYYYFAYNARLSSYLPNFAGVIAEYNGLPGMEWLTRISTPNRFRNTSGSSRSGIGQWVQLCNIFRQQRIRAADGTTYPLTTSTNGEFWLDNIYPYSAFFPADSPDSGDHTSEDRPESAFNSFANAISISDWFQLFVMYQPPDTGYGVQWVSLHRTYWNWQVYGEKQSGSTLNWLPNPPGGVTADGGQRWWLHPVWSNVFGNI